MAKPILVVYYLPEENGMSVEKMNDILKEKFDDYHTIALPSYHSMEGLLEHIRFEVFNADRIGPIEFEQFKNQILETITNAVE